MLCAEQKLDGAFDAPENSGNKRLAASCDGFAFCVHDQMKSRARFLRMAKNDGASARPEFFFQNTIFGYRQLAQ
jgi:hypothetical protein